MAHFPSTILILAQKIFNNIVPLYSLQNKQANQLNLIIIFS